MVKTSKEIKKGWNKKHWPNLEQMWLQEPKYTILDDIELELIVNECSVTHYKYIPNVWECNNYALQLQAKVQNYQYDTIVKNTTTGKHYSWFFGHLIMVVDDPFRGKYVHAINIAETNTGTKLIEPRNNEIFKPTNEDVFFIVC